MNNKTIIPKRGKHYWILKQDEETPEIARYERAFNGEYFFYQIEMNYVPECKSVDVPFEVIKEVIFEDENVNF